MEYTIQAPDDFKIVVDEKNKVIKIAPKMTSAKFGDIIAMDSPYHSYPIISIVKEFTGFGNEGFESVAFVSHGGDLYINNTHGYHEDNTLRCPTEAEKQLLFRKLKSIGWNWNAEKRGLECVDQLDPNIIEILKWKDDKEHLFFRVDANIVYGYSQSIQSLVCPIITISDLTSVSCRVEKVNWEDLKEGDLFLYNSFDNFSEWIKSKENGIDEYAYVDWFSFKISDSQYVSFLKGSFERIQSNQCWSFFKVIPISKP